jgi:transposase InsO family protein
MPWNEVDVEEQRIRFAVLAERGEHTMAELCREFGISRQAGYKWRQRYREEGVAGLAERSRRPHGSPEKTPEPIEQRVVEQREKRPDWGARKLQVKLAEEGVKLPVITIHRILLRRGLVAAEDRIRPALRRFERAEPNELWQMDFKGMPSVWQTAGLTPLSILDDHSRYLLALRAQQHTKGKPVRETLEEVFTRCGMPRQMLLDHGTPWWNMQGAGWTRLSVWLMQQGVELRFSGYRHPQTQGKVERMHGSLQRALERRGRPRRGEDWQSWLDAFREEYNHARPHESLLGARGGRYRRGGAGWETLGDQPSVVEPGCGARAGRGSYFGALLRDDGARARPQDGAFDLASGEPEGLRLAGSLGRRRGLGAGRGGMSAWGRPQALIPLFRGKSVNDVLITNCQPCPEA